MLVKIIIAADSQTLRC